MFDDVSADAAARGIQLVTKPYEQCFVRCDPGLLAVLIGNLVRNAVKYMGDTAVRRISVGVTSTSGCVRIEVSDTGPGIPEEIRGRIFEPFVRGVQTREAGIGLGLATVSRLVAAHGGGYGVESAPGAGTTFWFTLPEARAGVGRREPAVVIPRREGTTTGVQRPEGMRTPARA